MLGLQSHSFPCGSKPTLSLLQCSRDSKVAPGMAANYNSNLSKNGPASCLQVPMMLQYTLLR